MSITGQGSNASCRVAESRSGALGESSSECLEGAAKQGNTAGQLRTRTIFGFDAGENLAKPNLKRSGITGGRPQIPEFAETGAQSEFSVLATNADPRVEWGTGRDVPPLVPAVSARTATGAEGGCLNAPVFSGLPIG